jgi:hypothetical protein
MSALSDLLDRLAARPGVLGVLLGRATAQGALKLGVLEYDAGRVIIHPMRQGASLLLLVRHDVNVGELLFVLPQHTDSLSALL